MFVLLRDLDEIKNEIDKDAREMLESRFERNITDAKSFLIEKYYIDREWRDEYSLFYSKSYYSDLNIFTTRIHLFDRVINTLSDIKNLESKDYLGYIVMRPPALPRSARILKAFLRPKKETLGVKENENLYMLLCDARAHIGGKAFTIAAFPFYSQDSMVSVCAHASMWMACYYMHKKFGFRRPYLTDFAGSIPPFFGRVIPSAGLSLYQIPLTLTSMGYNVRLHTFRDKDVDSFLQILDGYLESALPTLLVFDEHVVVVTGHTLNQGERNYIIFDDSGYHLQRLVGKNVFASEVQKDKLKTHLQEVGEFFMINFEFERQHFPIESVHLLTDALFGENTIRRVVLLDSRKFKEIMLAHGITVLEDVDLPHYIYIVEVYENDEIVAMLMIDASAHKFDFSRSILAMWTENGDLKIYKSRKVFNIGIRPFVVPNLGEV